MFSHSFAPIHRTKCAQNVQELALSFVMVRCQFRCWFCWWMWWHVLGIWGIKLQTGGMMISGGKGLLVGSAFFHVGQLPFRFWCWVAKDMELGPWCFRLVWWQLLARNMSFGVAFAFFLSNHSGVCMGLPRTWNWGHEAPQEAPQEAHLTAAPVPAE